jgi:hypothetical protein
LIALTPWSVVLAAPQYAVAQTTDVASRSDLVARWRAAGTDTVRLTTLADQMNLRGAFGAEVILGLVADSTMPEVSRLYALWSLDAYYGQWSPDCFYPFPYSGRPPRFGDFGCTVIGVADSTGRPPVVPPPLRPSAELREVSITPSMRDTIRVRLQRVAASGQVAQAVAQVVARLMRNEQWDDGVRTGCASHATAFAVARAMPPLVISQSDVDLFNSCTATGPPAAAVAWQLIADTTSIKALATLSVAFRDQRVYDALLRTASDASRPLFARLAALDAFAAEVYEGASRTALARVRAANYGTPLTCAMPDGSLSHIVQQSGTVPLRSDAFARGIADLRRLAERGDSSAIRDEANAVADCVELIAARVRASTGS